jgi:hypothetical protein
MTAPELPDPRTARLIRHFKRAVWLPTAFGLCFVGCLAVFAFGIGTVEDALVSAGLRAEHAFDRADFLDAWALFTLELWVRLVLLGVCLAAFAWVLPVSARDVALAKRSLRDEHLQNLLAADDEQRAAAQRRAAVAGARARSAARTALRPTRADRRRRSGVPTAPRVAGTRR